MKHFENVTVKVLVLTCLFIKLARASDVLQLVKEAITADFLNNTFFLNDESENSEVIEIPNGDENKTIVKKKERERNHDHIKITYSDNNKNIDLTVYGYNTITLKVEHVEDNNKNEIKMSLKERSSKIILPVIKFDLMDSNLKQLVIIQIKSNFIYLFENYFYNIALLKQLENKQDSFEEEDDCFEQFINLISTGNKNKSSKVINSNPNGIKKKGSNKNYFMISFNEVLKEHFSKKTNNEFKYVIFYNDLINGKIFIKLSIPGGPDEYRYFDYNEIKDFFTSFQFPFNPISPNIIHILIENHYGNGSEIRKEKNIIPGPRYPENIIPDPGYPENDNNNSKIENEENITHGPEHPENNNIQDLIIEEVINNGEESNIKNDPEEIISKIEDNENITGWFKNAFTNLIDFFKPKPEPEFNIPEELPVIPGIISKIEESNDNSNVLTKIKIYTPCLLI